MLSLLRSQQLKKLEVVDKPAASPSDLSKGIIEAVLEARRKGIDGESDSECEEVRNDSDWEDEWK